MIYLLLAKASLEFANANNATVFWAPAGLALAALLRFGFKVWPGIFMGAFAAGLMVGDSPGVAAAIALGNTLEPLFGARLLLRCGFRRSLRRLRDYALLLLWAALVSTLISAALGPWALVAGGLAPSSGLPLLTLRWWMADAMGVMLAAPLILIWRALRENSGRFSLARVLEGSVVLGLTFLVGQVIFVGWWPDLFGDYAKGFLIFPILVLATLRYSCLGAAVVILQAFMQTLWGGIEGAGYFGQVVGQAGWLNPWLYHMALNLTGISLTLVLYERERANLLLARGRQMLSESHRREYHRNQVLAMLAAVAPLTEVLETLVRGIESQRPGMKGSVLLVDEGNQCLVLGAAPSFSGDFNAAIHGLRIGQGQGACGHAVFSGQRMVIENLFAHPYSAPFQHLFTDAGVAACWSEPIRGFDGKVLGTFALYHDRPSTPTSADFAMIEYAAHLAGIAIEKSRYQEELELAGLVYRCASEAVMVTDAQNLIIAVNPAFTDLTGYEAHEVIGRQPSMLKSGQNQVEVYKSLWSSINTKGSWQGEIWNRRKNGELYVEWLTINVLRDSQGAIHRYIGIFSDITQRKLAEEQIWHQANYDGLTDLPNRRLFHDRLQQEMKKSRRENTKLALLLLDLDFFKAVNDNLGHDVGDALLLEAARRIGACIRETDTLARLGGDEFAVVLPHLTGDTRVEQAASAILETLSRRFQLGENIAHISASIGIAIYPDDAEDQATLLKFADQAMYEAKKRGRNTYYFFTQGMRKLAEERQQIINELREGWGAGQFEVRYQPIVGLVDDRIVKVEALLFWSHPVRGVIGLGEFLALAEEIGLITALGDWSFRECLAQAQQWARLRADAPQICINMSPRQFFAVDNLAVWLDYIDDIGVPNSKIAFEITENLLLDQRPEIEEKLACIREAGIELTIDDFGTGYSSLTCARKCGASYLKIDRAFIIQLNEDRDARALADAIIAMAHKLDLKVIAEGVENLAQRDILRAAGCDYAQGYFYAKPLSAAEMTVLLQADND